MKYEMVVDRRKEILWWNYLVVTLFIFTSGSVFWKGGISGTIAYPLFLLVALINAFIIKKKWKINFSVVYILICVLLCIIHFFLYSDIYKDNSMLAFFISMSATLLVLSSSDYYYFRKLLTNVVYFVVLIGIPIFFISELSTLPLSTLAVSGGKVYSMFGIYTLGWYPYYFHRFAGIWHEPGACQIILNTVLWMNFDSIVQWKWEKGQLRKCIVVLIGSLLTLSTGSYLVLMLLAGAVLLNVKFSGKYRFWVLLLLLLIVPAIIYAIYSSSVIQDKLFDASGEMESKVVRYGDINALWKMILNKPIWGYGLGTTDFWVTAYRYGNVSTSSGVLAYIASLGILWFFSYLYFLWKGCQHLNLGRGTICLVMAVLIMQFNEYYIEYPISCVFLFKYATYCRMK